ncbi:MAG: prenyltransferase/squalene oxidase repeat-containing protein [Planctomycetota bacterium]
MNTGSNYLRRLTIRLAMGLQHVAPETRVRHAEFLKGAQQPDGGFPGRLGQSDLYYTSFALRTLAVLGELQGDLARRAANFLQSRLEGPEKLIDQMSLIFGAALLQTAAGLNAYGAREQTWTSQFTERIEQLRRDDGGYAKGPEGAASSTYHTFLSLLCLQLIGQPCVEPERAIEFTRSQGDAMGGFREIRVSKRAGTNPTAAAIGILQMLNALDDSTRKTTAEFLAKMQDGSGGFLANSRIPMPDVLSTFTGVSTLADLGELDLIDTPAALRFVRSLEQPTGGFRAAPWDDVSDVEYTFYGLGALALLAPPDARQRG